MGESCYDYYSEEDIEKMFYKDVKNKKRTASGVYHKRGKKGYVGTMRTPMDYLSGKAKKEYTRGGQIIVSNMYKDIKKVPSLEEIEGKGFEQAKKMIATLKKMHSSTSLRKHWSVSGYTLYEKVYKKYGIEIGEDRRNKNKNQDKEDNLENKGSVKDRSFVNTDKIVNELQKTNKDESEATITGTSLQANSSEKSEVLEVHNNSGLPIPLDTQSMLLQFIQNQQNIIHNNNDKENDEDLFQFKYTKKETIGDIIQKNIINFLNTLESDKKYSVKFEIKEVV